MFATIARVSTKFALAYQCELIVVLALIPRYMPVELFYSYAHEDEALRDELEKHLSLLKRSGLIVAWHDRRIGVGEEWRHQIDAHARSADIILLLVSPDFLASDYCYNVEMNLALERHDRHEAIVIPIILRPVDWSGAPFAHLQALRQDAKPLTVWANRDEAFLNIAQGIRELVLQGESSPTPTTRAAKREPQQRILDAAMPSHIVKDQTTELQVLIRLPDSAGLKVCFRMTRTPRHVRKMSFRKSFRSHFLKDWTGIQKQSWRKSR